MDLGATSNKGQVLRFNADGTFDKQYDQPAGGLTFQFPSDLAFDAQGRLFTANLGPAYPPALQGSVNRYLAGGTFDQTLLSSAQVGNTTANTSGFSPSQLVFLPAAGVTVNGTLQPGGPGTPGVLTAGDVTFGAGGTFAVALDGNVAGSGYGQLATAGNVSLNDANLAVTRGFSAPVGTPFTIIKDAGRPVSGTFLGLPEGGTLGVSGQPFVITYHGGAGGNDVVLTAAGGAAAPPTISAAFGGGSIPLGGSTTLTFTVTNPNGAAALAGVSFADTLPAGLTVANGTSAVGGGTLTLTAPGTITYSGGTIAAGGNLTFGVTVTGSATGVYADATGNATAANGGTGNAAAANLAVVAPPTIAAAFANGSIPLGGNTTLAFTLTNPNGNGIAETGVSFTDTLPAGLTVANGTSAVGGGTLTLTAPGTISFSGGTVAAGSNVTFGVTVTGAAAGGYADATGNVSSGNGGAGNAATANLTVVAPPTIGAAFGGGSVPLGGSTTLTFTVTNPNGAAALAGVAFADTLPAGLTVANGTSAVGGGTLTLTAPGTITYSGGTVAAGGNLTFGVAVTGSAAGTYADATGNVTAANGGTGNAAAANLTVTAGAVQFAAANETLGKNAGGFTLAVTLTGASGNATTVPFTLGGSAAAGVNYLNLSGPLVIPAGQTAANITGTLVDLGVYGGGASKTLTVTLGAPGNAVLGSPATNVLTISPVAARPSYPSLTTQERYVQALYLNELGRAGATAELDSWLPTLNASGGAAAVAGGVKGSMEGTRYLARTWYQIYLGRPAANGEEMVWAYELGTGQAEETVLGQFLGTGEFYNHAQTLAAGGAPDQRYVQALYLLLLHRPAAASETAYWVGRLPQAGAGGVATEILGSQEFRRGLFTEYYQQLLHRTPDAAGLNAFVTSSPGVGAVRTQFEVSSEFLGNG